jgi:hypothetical protein
MRYFEVRNDVYDPYRFYVGKVSGPAVHQCGDEFTWGEPVEEMPLIADVKIDGRALDFTFGDFDVPLVRMELVERLRPSMSREVQWLPIAVRGVEATYSVMNVLQVIDCLDTDRSEGAYWGPEAEIEDFRGKPIYLTKLAVSPDRIGKAAIFRVKDWGIPIIVAEPVAEILSTATGIKLIDVDSG